MLYNYQKNSDYLYTCLDCLTVSFKNCQFENVNFIGNIFEGNLIIDNCKLFLFIFL